MTDKPRAITLCSGGLDSVVLATYLKACGYEQVLLAFDYNQRNRFELSFVERTATRLCVPHLIFPLALDKLAPAASSLLPGGETVPTDEASMTEKHRSVYVPNRNILFLAAAYALALAQTATCVAIGAEGDTANVSPDSFEDTLTAYDTVEHLATRGYASPDLHLYAPFAHMTKAQVVALGDVLKVPFHDTWSCYEGNAWHCGSCRACQSRRAAFEAAGVTDPTVYKEVAYV